MCLVCDLAPAAHQVWHNICLLGDRGDINHCLVKAASAMEDPHHWHRKAWLWQVASVVLNDPHHPRSIHIRGVRTSCLWAAQALRHQPDRTFALSHPCGVEMFSCCISHSQWEWPGWLHLSCSYMQKAQSLHTSKFCCHFSSSTPRVGSAEPFTPGWSCRMKALLGTCAVTRWLHWVCELQPCHWPFLHARL